MPDLGRRGHKNHNLHSHLQHLLTWTSLN
jgi:hypothetical protein